MFITYQVPSLIVSRRERDETPLFAINSPPSGDIEPIKLGQKKKQTGVIVLGPDLTCSELLGDEGRERSAVRALKIERYTYGAAQEGGSVHHIFI